ncbi:MAG TPA: tetratricopeptide repeat protein [Chroococcales cyanobacterium]
MRPSPAKFYDNALRLGVLLILSLLGAAPVQAGAADEQCWQLIQQARGTLSHGDTKGALATFAQASSINPADPRPYFWQALILDEQGELNKAVDKYTECIARAKEGGYDCAEMRVNLGNTLMKLNYLKEAEYDFQRALKIDSRLNIAHLFLGRLYLERGQYQKALSELDICNQQGFRDRSIPYLKALAFKELGRKGDARAQLEFLLRAHNPAAGEHDPLIDRAAKLMFQIEAGK